MKWPWVSRRAYDIACGERDHLRVQVSDLIEHTKRMDRVEHGLHEVPREQRPPLEPMPPKLQQWINGFGMAPYRKMLRDNAYRRHARSEPWTSICADMMGKEDEDAPDPTSEVH